MQHVAKLQQNWQVATCWVPTCLRLVKRPALLLWRTSTQCVTICISVLQDHVQRWFQDHAATHDMLQSSTSSVTLTTVQGPHSRRYSAACQQHEHIDSSQPAACAAAAAAIALYGKQAGLSADAAAAAVGAAAVFAQRLSSSSEPGSSYQVRRVCTARLQTTDQDSSPSHPLITRVLQLLPSCC
jgi:hypothetical protein